VGNCLSRGVGERDGVDGKMGGRCQEIIRVVS